MSLKTEHITSNIEEIYSELQENYANERAATDSARWRRGLLYTKAREILGRDKYKAILDKKSDVAHWDDDTVRTKLMRCIEYLDEKMFLWLGYSRAVEFSISWLWKFSGTNERAITDRNLAMMNRAINEHWTIKKCRKELENLKLSLKPAKTQQEAQQGDEQPQDEPAQGEEETTQERGAQEAAAMPDELTVANDRARRLKGEVESRDIAIDSLQKRLAEMEESEKILWQWLQERDQELTELKEIADGMTRKDKKIAELKEIIYRLEQNKPPITKAA